MKDCAVKLRFYLSPEGLLLAERWGLVLPISPYADDEVDPLLHWNETYPPPIFREDSSVTFGGMDAAGKVVFIIDTCWPTDKIKAHLDYWVMRLRALAGMGEENEK